MTLADRLRANAALLDYATRRQFRLTQAHRRALVADLLQQAAEAEAMREECEALRRRVAREARAA